MTDIIHISYEEQLETELNQYHDEVIEKTSSYIKTHEKAYRDKRKGLIYHTVRIREEHMLLIYKLAKELIHDLKLKKPKLDLPIELKNNLEIILPFLSQKERYDINDALYSNLKGKIRNFNTEIHGKLSKILKAKMKFWIPKDKMIYGRYASYPNNSKKLRETLKEYCEWHLNEHRFLNQLEVRDIHIEFAKKELEELDKLIESGTFKNRYIIDNYQKIKDAYITIDRLEYINHVIDKIINMEESTSKIDWIKLKKVLTKIQQKNKNIISIQRRFLSLNTRDFDRVKLNQDAFIVQEQLSTTLSEKEKYEIVRRLAVKQIYIREKISAEIYKFYVDNNYNIDISKISDKKQLKNIKKAELLIAREIANLVKTYHLQLQELDVHNNDNTRDCR